MSREQRRALRPPAWLIPGMLPEGFLLLHGQWGSGKSFVALDIAKTLNVLGRRVLYCAGEGVEDFEQREAAWELAHPSLRAQYPLDALLGTHFPHLMDPRSMAALHHDVQWMDPQPALVIIDTWARALVGGDENSYTHMQQGVEELAKLRNLYGCSVLVVHHDPVPMQGQPRRSRGHGALEAACDCIWQLLKPADTDVFPVHTARNRKQKFYREQPSFEFRLEPSGESVVPWPTTPMRLELT